MRGIKNNLYKDLKGRVSSLIITYHHLETVIIRLSSLVIGFIGFQHQDAAAALGSEVEDMGFATGTFSATGRPQK